MGLYRDRILPHLIHRSMRSDEVTPHRKRLIPAAEGRVLEVGIGSGLNLPFYSDAVSEVTGVDPSARLIEMARRTADTLPLTVGLSVLSAEDLPFDDAQFDTVVSTWTLCSIPDVAAALGEIRRVLKPGGAFLFVEHGAAPERRIAAWQSRLNPIWQRCSGGCQLNRPIDALIAEAGFRFGQLETGYLVKGPKLLTFHYLGRASLP